MRRAVLAIPLAVVALAGCSVAPPPLTVIASVPCLPPGIRGDFFAWPVVAFQPVELKNEDGEEVEARVVLYQRGHDSVAVVWVGADIIAVDPSPDTPEPDWIDESLVTDGELTLRMRPEAPCQWRRPKQRA